MMREYGLSVLMLRPLAQIVGRLGADPARFLASLGVGPTTSVDAYLPAARVDDALDELVDLGLLLDSDGGRYRFHDLVRLFARTRLEEEESPAERAALTARIRRSAAAAALDDAMTPAP